jgi:hypothetical protein
VDELNAATARDKLIVLFGHHPVRSLCAPIPDENAAPCTTQHNHGDNPEHDRNPGCDLDPRNSQPLHMGEPSQRAEGDETQTLTELVNQYPYLIAYVSGHTHDNNVTAFPRTPDGGIWWGIETSATSDWPVQHRLIEVMDNHDGTLSIFGTLLDHAGASATPPEGSAAGFNAEQLASIGRTFTYNDPQAGDGTGEGAANDQNVELLVPDPRIRRGYARPKSATPVEVKLVPAFEECVSSNATHGAPLAVPSCSPPQQASDYLTLGAPDVTGTPAASSGSLGLKQVGENPINPENGDQSDVEITASITDVKNQGSFTDYEGELRFVPTLRITDRFNGVTGAPTQDEPATTMDVPLPFTVACTATDGPAGATCNVSTTADAVTGGNVAQEGKRAIWELGQVEVFDGGSDGDADTTGDNTLFAVQGLFTP